jgi:hypothetical protein
MKPLITIALIAVAALTLASNASAAEALPPGQVDFGTFAPPKGDGEFVEVNLSPAMIGLASRLVEKDQPEVAQVLAGLKLVRVNVIGLSDDNRSELHSRAQKVREDLASKGWERVVTAQQKNQDVSLYLKITGEGAVQGMAAVIFDNKEHAVFVNIVGDIKPDQIAMLGEKLHIDPLKQLNHLDGNTERKQKAKNVKSSE